MYPAVTKAAKQYFLGFIKRSNIHYNLIPTNQSKTYRLKRKPFLSYCLDLFTMTLNDQIKPPEKVKGMTELCRADFSSRFTVPAVKIPVTCVGGLKKSLASLQFMMPKIKPIVDLEDTDPDYQKQKLILLDPNRFQSAKDLNGDELSLLNKHNVDLTSWQVCNIDITYNHWTYNQIFRAVLPESCDGVGGFSTIGHIVHLNLDDSLTEYKSLIGQVLLDKVPTAKTVVNKTHAIDNTYRNFSMEVIAGCGSMVTTTKEHGLTFQMDFSKVYWNPRLSTEHQRIVEQLSPGDIVYDMFAGIGPFAIPAAKKKKCTVLANDLNPESYKWLNVNIKLNKTGVDTYNLDGRQFVGDVVKPHLSSRWRNASLERPRNIHIIMNLPALGVEFLDVFHGLFTADDFRDVQHFIAPKIHCYLFSKAEDLQSDVKERVKENLGFYPPGGAIVRKVRNVAPNKEMMYVTFELNQEILMESIDGEEPANKKLKI